MKKTLFLLVCVFLIIGCSQKSDKKILKSSNGRLNHLILVIDNAQWQEQVGDKIRDILTAPVPGLPQPEPQFDISQVTENNLGALLKTSRNLLRVIVGDSSKFNIEKDVWAAPQRVITIQGTNESDLMSMIQKHEDELISTFKEADLELVKKRISKDHHPPKKIETFNKLGFSLQIPSSFKKVEDNGGMVWYRSHINGGDSMELFAYTAPKNDDFELMNDAIIVNRNAFGKKHVPGELGGSYMITEEAYTPHVYKLEVNGYKAYESRGKWEVKKMYMAGPFLNYTFLDEKNNRLVVVEGLTYAPATKKRNYMFELEAILKTIKIE